MVSEHLHKETELQELEDEHDAYDEGDDDKESLIERSGRRRSGGGYSRSRSYTPPRRRRYIGGGYGGYYYYTTRRRRRSACSRFGSTVGKCTGTPTQKTLSNEQCRSDCVRNWNCEAFATLTSASATNCLTYGPVNGSDLNQSWACYVKKCGAFSLALQPGLLALLLLTALAH